LAPLPTPRLIAARHALELERVPPADPQRDEPITPNEQSINRQ
jgi:hypothetical protein